MSLSFKKLYFFYLGKHYLKNLISILFGLSFAFSTIDYFQHIQKLNISGNHKILYIFYMWQEALGMLYPLAIVFALIMTKLSFIKNSTMGAFYSFGYSKKQLLLPILTMSALIYSIFFLLNMTEFSYAKDKASLILKNELEAYKVNDLFFKYNDTFVYINTLDPIEKKIKDITIFKVKNDQVRYTINASYATFKNDEWIAHNAVVKTHIYKDKQLIRYKVEHKDNIITLKGYKPKIIESLYEGKALNIIDAYHTLKLLKYQHLNSDKIREVIYTKVVVPLFSLALVIILFFKIPFHSRMMNSTFIIASSLGATFFIWGILFGLNQIGSNGVIAPELTSILPIVLLWIYALYIYFTNEKTIS